MYNFSVWDSIKIRTLYDNVSILSLELPLNAQRSTSVYFSCLLPCAELNRFGLAQLAACGVVSVGARLVAFVTDRLQIELAHGGAAYPNCSA